MNKFIIIGLILVAFASSNHAQSAFSKQNLEQASQDDLNSYLTKAKSQKTTGLILSIAGSVAVISIRNTDANISLDAAAAIFLIGSAATLIGIPVFIIGSSRVNTINRIKNSNGFTMELSPCSFYNYQAQSHQPGVTLRINF